MNCHRVQSLISAYVDCELPGLEMLAIRQHLSECEECMMDFESMRRIKRAFGTLQPKTPSPDLAMRICMQINQTVAVQHTERTERQSIMTVMRSHFRLSAFPGSWGLASAAVGLLIAMLLVDKSPTQNTRYYTYNGSPLSILTSSFKTEDTIRSLSDAPVGTGSVVDVSTRPFETPDYLAPSKNDNISGNVLSFADYRE